MTKIDLSRLDESMLGRETPDPLQFAFAGKVSAHAGMAGRPLPPAQGTPMLTAMMHKSAISGQARCLYIHIPFCRVRCTFCTFFQYAASPAWMETYLQALLEEMRWKSAFPWVQSAPFDAVYVGGGTPTDLSAVQIAMLGEYIQKLFPLSADCEITLEGRLNGFSDEKYQAALASGFNRFSFGVQSFDSQIRRAAKRLDRREQVISRLQQLSARGEAPIIIDLLFGLPYQDEKNWQQDIEDFLDSGAHGVDLYQLIEMQGTPMQRLVEQGRQPAPAITPEKALRYAYGATRLEQAGLQRLSSCHWARDKRERSRYNALAKTSADVLPLGASAGGVINGVALMQHRDLETYQQQVTSGTWPLAMMVAPSEHYRRDAVVKSAFDVGVLDGNSWQQSGYPDLFVSLLPLLQAWQSRGLLSLADNNQIATLTLAGRFWNVNLAQASLQALRLAAGEMPVMGMGGHPHARMPAGHPGQMPASTPKQG